MLDLDKARTDRAEAAKREGRGEPLRVRFGGNVIAELPPEMPLDALAPLRDIDGEISLLLREAITIAQSTSAGAKVDTDTALRATGLVVDLVTMTPNLPTKILGVIEAVAERLMGRDGLDAFLTLRPTREDVAALVKGVFSFYGLGLGESSPSSETSGIGGQTSNAISSGSTDSTSEAPTAPQGSPASSAFAGSSA